eukprot:780215_1
MISNSSTYSTRSSVYPSDSLLQIETDVDNGEIDKFNTLRLGSPAPSPMANNATASEIDDSDDEISEHAAELQSLFPPKSNPDTETTLDMNQATERPRVTKQNSIVWGNNDLLLDSHQTAPRLSKPAYTTNSNRTTCSCFTPFIRSMFQSNDPYIRLTLIPTKDSKTTHSVYGVKQNAMWLKSDKNRKQFFIPTAYVENRLPIKMLVECWDAELDGSDVFIGSRVVDLKPSTHELGTKQKLQIKLRDSAKYKGLLTLNVVYTETMTEKTHKTLKKYLKQRHKQRKKAWKRRQTEVDTDFAAIQRQSDLDRQQTYGIIACEILTLEGAEADASNLQKSRDWFILTGCIVGYVTIGAAVYSYLEGFPYLDAVYFCAVSISSCGYGDMFPTTFYSKLFCIFYVTISHLMIFVMITSFTERIIHKRHDKAEKRRQSDRRRSRLLQRLGREIKIGGKMNRRRKNVMELNNEDRQWYMKKNGPSGSYPVIVWYVLFFAVWLVGWAAYFVYLAKHKLTWFEAIYFGIITATTVGYGDHNANDDWDRKIFITCFVLIGVATLANVAGAISVWIADRRIHKFQGNVLSTALSTVEDLKEFDECNDGEVVTRAEFLQGMLLKMRLVDQSIIDSINQKFVNYGGIDGQITLEELKMHLKEKSVRKS